MDSLQKSPLDEDLISLVGIGIKLPLQGFLWLLAENAGNEGIGGPVGASAATVYSGPSWHRGVEEGSPDKVSRLQINPPKLYKPLLRCFNE